ncbi:HalOD1 output domain-containing protein [Haladaptatus salinisoli]|uniref:HalOD1 output domain-containing protein n=1 Tax=Haladaptatus salinisoli TaxID=2884876 RepID=UPI001D0A0753|nr:HalOD1 output domain-containing protein [Haladaptatus salinisoli]
MDTQEKDEVDRYHPNEDQTLSTAVLEAIEKEKGEDLTKAEFRLYDDIDPDALNNLFQKNANANTTVEFSTDDVTVRLWGDGGVEIQIMPRDTNN